MSTPTTGLAVHPLRGMDQRHRAQPNRARLARDVTWDKKDSWKVGPGFRQLVVRSITGSPFNAEGRILSMHGFSQHDGALQWLIWESVNPSTGLGTLRAFNGSLAPLGAWTNLRSAEGVEYDGDSANNTRKVVNTPWAGTQSQVVGGRLYLVNGYDDPLVFDGLCVERAGFEGQPSPPEVLVADKTGGVQQPDILDPAANEVGLGHRNMLSAYRYKVTFVNIRGQESPASPPSPIVQFTNTNANRFTAWVELPTGGPEVVARRVYRTQNLIDMTGSAGDGAALGPNPSLGRDYYFVDEVPDNCCTVYVDLIPDVSLGTPLIEENLGAWPGGSSLIALYADTLFLAGAGTAEVRFSRPGFPEVFPPGNVFDFSDATGGAITGLYPLQGALVVLKARGIYLIKGSATEGFSRQTLTRDTGCCAPNTIKELPGLGLVFLSHSGVMLLQGALQEGAPTTAIVNLSETIPDLIETINGAALENARAAVWRKHQEYWLAVPVNGADRPTRVLKYHYAIGEWSYSEGFPISAIVETGDHRGELLFGSWDTDTAPGIHWVSHGQPTRHGKALTASLALSPRYTTVDLNLGSLYETVQPYCVLVQAIGYGKNDLAVDFYVNRKIVAVYAEEGETHSENQHYGNDDGTMPYYGEAVWGTGTWGEHREVVLRYDLSGLTSEPIQELRLDFTPPTGCRCQIVGYELHLVEPGKRKIRPITEAFGGG